MAMSDDVKQIYDLFGPTVAKLNDTAIRIEHTANTNRVLLIGEDGHDGMSKRIEDAAKSMEALRDRWDKYLETRAQTCPIGQDVREAIGQLRKDISDRAEELYKAQQNALGRRATLVNVIVAGIFTIVGGGLGVAIFHFLTGGA